MPILKKSEGSVFFYLPNIVGYIRIVLLILGLSMTSSKPLWAAFYCILAALLDMVDGFLARLLKQSSQFGAIFDYAFDRVTLACYLFLLAYLYPSFWLLFTFLLSLDILAHLFHLQSALLLNKGAHKTIEEQAPRLLRFYYSNRFILAIICAMHDLFFCALYLYYFYPNRLVTSFLVLLFPGFFLKTMIHFAKVIRASVLLSKAG